MTWLDDVEARLKAATDHQMDACPECKRRAAASLADVGPLVERARAADALYIAAYLHDHCVHPTDDGDPCGDCEVVFIRAGVAYKRHALAMGDDLDEAARAGDRDA